MMLTSIQRSSPQDGLAKEVVQATFEISSSRQILPAFLIKSITIFNKVHRVWRAFRLTAIYSNPNNFLKLAAGHTANHLLGDSVFLKFSAFCVLIATRILDCTEQLALLQEAWGQCISAWKGYYPTPIKIKWNSEKGYSFPCRSLAIRMRYTYLRGIDRIQRIARSVLRLCKEAFVLSMRFTDAVETFYLNPETKNEGINLLFLNGSRCIEELCENKDALLLALEKNKEVIDKILTGINAPIKTSDLSEHLKIALKKTKGVLKGVNNVSQQIGWLIKTLGRNWAYEGASYVGLENLVPPPVFAQPYRKTSNKQTERFPDPELLRKDL